ncbi:MAG: hypothetical protein QXI36_04015 [Candidatus Bathyarchaeia archaeon]
MGLYSGCHIAFKISYFDGRPKGVFTGQLLRRVKRVFQNPLRKFQ